MICLLLTVGISSCQQKQVFSESTEIDLIKSANQAYLKGDWEAFRALYADTARILINTWNDRLTPDEVTEQFRSGLADIAEYKISDEISQMVITDKGEHQVSQWFEWTGKHKNGKEIRTVVYLFCQVENNKIVFSGLIYNTLPFYLAAQPDSLNPVAAK